MNSETYIADRLEWLKEAADGLLTLFRPGSSGLEDEEETGKGDSA